jgi:hypothetical protein
MGKFKMPTPGEQKKATITRVERSTAGEQFTSKKTGKFAGKFSEPDDPVFVLYGKIEGMDVEQKLGTVNSPSNKAGVVFGTSKLHKILESAGLSEVSDDLHELRGKSVVMIVDAKGFTRLA